jgi:hypothetical protein
MKSASFTSMQQSKCSDVLLYQFAKKSKPERDTFIVSFRGVAGVYRVRSAYKLLSAMVAAKLCLKQTGVLISTSCPASQRMEPLKSNHITNACV